MQQFDPGEHADELILYRITLENGTLITIRRPHEICRVSWLTLGMTQKLLDIARPGDMMLEVGHGCGFTSIAAAKAGLRVEAVDINEVAVNITRLNAKINGVFEDRLRSVHDDFSQRNFGDRKFDFIVCNVPTETLADTAQAQEIQRRLLQGDQLQIDGGYAINYYTAPDNRSSLLDVVLQRAPEILSPYGRVLIVSGNIRHRNIELTQNMLNLYGYTIDDERFLFGSFEGFSRQYPGDSALGLPHQYFQYCVFTAQPGKK